MRNQKGKIFCCLAMVAVLLCLTAALSSAAEIGFFLQGDKNPHSPSYGWWYGCSPTSAGMMMGFYDLKGYGGKSYANLDPYGPAATSTIHSDGAWNATIKSVIASQGHVVDFYRYANCIPDLKTHGYGAFGVSGDDVAYPTHSFNSLADFMGTSQDAVGNSNG